MKTIVLGAVAYDPKVVPIWDAIREFSNDFGYKMDYVLFSNYEAQVAALVENKIDIAWNTNVAWIRTLHLNKNAKAIAMRDTDWDFKSIFVSRKDSAIASLADLKGKKFGLGSLDSAQAAIIPAHYLKDSGAELVRFNSDLGKHGDTGRSEFDVLNAIKSGELVAGAIGSSTWARILSEGSYPEIASFWESPGYCHCNFSILPSFEFGEGFVKMLLEMNKNKTKPIIAQTMQAEGLNEWIVVGKRELGGYNELQKAMSEQNLLENKF